MTFQRAKNAKQRQQRIDEIIAAVIELYNEIGYDKITFSKISEKLRFTRATLYNYFTCKEDIFLLILENDIKEMVEDAKAVFAVPCKDEDSFLDAYTELMLRHQRVLSLMSIVNTIILKGATAAAYIEYRVKLYRHFNKLTEIVSVQFPSLSRGVVLHFIDIANSFAMTLYAASLEYKKAQKIPVFPHAGYGTGSFGPQFKTALRFILSGFKFG